MINAYAAGSELTMSSMTHTEPIVFVVDDDVSIRESLEHLFRCEGWHAETFASASEFLAAPRPSVPSCLVLDVSMPGLNGLELQKRVANDRPGMPIVFITAHGNIPMGVKAMKAGAVEFLTKPFTEECPIESPDQGTRKISDLNAIKIHRRSDWRRANARSIDVSGKDLHFVPSCRQCSAEAMDRKNWSSIAHSWQVAWTTWRIRMCQFYRIPISTIYQRAIGWDTGDEPSCCDSSKNACVPTHCASRRLPRGSNRYPP
jgi:FixJ family two-component response regulator